MENAKMYDMVRVSKERLIGEIVELKGNIASIQVYEETGGLGPGDPVETTGWPLSVELGPGLIESIFDGIQRPLDIIYHQIGNLITRGVDVPGLDRGKKWEFNALVKPGQKVAEGDVLGPQGDVLYVHGSLRCRGMVAPRHPVSGDLALLEDELPAFILACGSIGLGGGPGLFRQGDHPGQVDVPVP